MLAGTESRADLKYHLRFTRKHKPKDKKTNIYDVIKVTFDKPHEHLGLIKWTGAFRKYWLEPVNDTGWSDDCLDLVSSFLKKVNKRYRQKQKRQRGMA